MSYIWDRMIEFFVSDYETTPEAERTPLKAMEATLRVLASESRFNRRILGHAFDEFMRKSDASEMGALL